MSMVEIKMSQEDVYKILKELGYEATSKAIKTKALEKFSALLLHTYVHNRLTRLEKKE